MKKTRYAHVGIGGRARMYYQAISKEFNETSELVAFCDVNRTRMEYANEVLVNEFGYHEVPMYGAEDFEKMIEEKNRYVLPSPAGYQSLSHAGSSRRRHYGHGGTYH